MKNNAFEIPKRKRAWNIQQKHCKGVSLNDSLLKSFFSKNGTSPRPSRIDHHTDIWLLQLCMIMGRLLEGTMLHRQVGGEKKLCWILHLKSVVPSGMALHFLKCVVGLYRPRYWHQSKERLVRAMLTYLTVSWRWTGLQLTQNIQEHWSKNATHIIMCICNAEVICNCPLFFKRKEMIVLIQHVSLSFQLRLAQITKLKKWIINNSNGNELQIKSTYCPNGNFLFDMLGMSRTVAMLSSVKPCIFVVVCLFVETFEHTWIVLHSAKS